MKSIKEKEALIKMSLILGVEPDIDMVMEVVKQKKILDEIKIDSNDFLNSLNTVLNEDDNKPVQYPIPPSLDDIAHLIVEEDITEKHTVLDFTNQIPLSPSLIELLEFHGIKDNEVPKNNLINNVKEAISAQIKNEQILNPKENTPLNESTLLDLQRKVRYLESTISRIAAIGPGGGEVNLRNLDDVDTSNLQNNFTLKYNSSNAKFEFAATSGAVSNSDIISALTSGQNISIAANGRITANVTSASVDLGNVSSNIIPTTDSIFNLGSPNKRFQSLFLANNTIDLGGSLISSDGTGTLTISATGAVLPAGSKISLNETIKDIALIGNTGTVVNVVPFFTQSQGLNTISARFEFGTDPDSYVFDSFLLNTGSPISTTSRAQFYF